tara:strand:+ start:521 stop:649 length:129 start_codon:yes stop_codon:yes gene_type:complete
MARLPNQYERPLIAATAEVRTEFTAIHGSALGAKKKSLRSFP